MSVDDPDVLETELLEQHAWNQCGLHALLDVFAHGVDALPDPGEPLHPAFQIAAQAEQGGLGAQSGEVGADGSHIPLDGHLVVVQDNHQRRLQVAGLVQTLVGHPPVKAPSPDDREDPALGALCRQPGCLGQTHPYTHRGTAVAGAESVVFTLAGLREARKAAERADGGKAVRPACQEFVSVRLVSHVPYDLVRTVNGVRRGGRW